jgi:hypothetical protein
MSDPYATLPAEHDAECRRELPYSSPLRVSLDFENCHRCTGLILLLERAKDRRLAAAEELKRRIISKLDGLRHGARGYAQSELLELVEGPETGRRIRLQRPLRELMEDRLIQEHVVSGVKRYVLYGR